MKSNSHIVTIAVLALIALIAQGCGGNSTKNPTPQGAPIDPTGNWKMVMSDPNGKNFLLSALFSQTGSTVTGVNFSEVGNSVSFQCQAQPDVTMANGTVQNVSTFSGDFSGNFGTIHFTSTLNDPGLHASGTYTVTPGANGNCLGVALTGTFVGDEVPSMTGNWTGTVNCTSNCPTGSTSGTINLSLTQNEVTGKVNGTYTVTGLPNLTGGNIATGTSDLLSGASWQDSLTDNSGSNFAIVGGPLNTFGTAGLALDRSFHGNIIEVRDADPNVLQFATYTVSMSH